MMIVNADDFGLAEHINRGIIETVRRGAVTSVSLVANGEAIDEAISFCKQTRNLSTGIHLTLIEEKPILAPEEIPSLVGSNGLFLPDYKSFITAYAAGRIRTDHIRKECAAQIARLKAREIMLSHCDSHQHIHLLKKVASAVVALCRENSIPRIRIVNEPPSIHHLSRMIPLIVMNWLSLRLRQRAARNGITTADRFFGFNTSMNINEEIINRALNAADQGMVELMCHPGYNTENSHKYKNWNMDWNRERIVLLKLLCSK